MSDKKPVAMVIELSPKINALLKLSAKASQRSKRAEAMLRLEDHLKKFTSICTVGDTRRRIKLKEGGEL